MTRLTLRWHLRGIVEGTTEPVCVRVDLDPEKPWDDPKYEDWGRLRAGVRYYADPYVEDNREQREYHDANSYTTGFTQESGDFCDAFTQPMARRALRADDAVAYLDGVAHDPTAPPDWRNDAAWLLSHHVIPEASENKGKTDGYPVSYWSTVRCPECYEGEVFHIDPPTGETTCPCGTVMKPPDAQEAAVW